MAQSTESTAAKIMDGPWPQRLEFVIDMMREMSEQTDPQAMVKAYAMRMRQGLPGDGWASLSRRNLRRPKVRVTRSHLWGFNTNPWTAREHTVFDRGLFSELIWNEEPVIIDEIRLADDDPCAPFVQGMRSLAAVPMFDQGASLNMVVSLCKDPHGFDREYLPERVWMANLFGRATQNLVLSGEVKRAYDAVDRELKVVADMQRSLLPRSLPNIPGLQLATHYQTSRRAGGDYYDFFELPGGLWGLLIADVSGHGTPAAVMMAVTHSIAHAHTGPPTPPSAMLGFINGHLTARYTIGSGTFVTAFYGIYDPRSRQLTYSCAGHCPPRIKCGQTGKIRGLDNALALPLRIEPDENYLDVTAKLEPGDALVLYTDGITEAHKPNTTELFGMERLDAVLNKCDCDPETIIRNTMLAVEDFTEDSPPTDDMTLVVARAVV